MILICDGRLYRKCYLYNTVFYCPRSFTSREPGHPVTMSADQVSLLTLVVCKNYHTIPFCQTLSADYKPVWQR